VLRRGGFVYPEPTSAQPATPVAVEPTTEEPPPVVEGPPPVAEARIGEVTAIPDGAPGSRDDLKLITGIGPVLEKKLNECGVFTYRHLAMLNDRDVERIETAIRFAGRVRREDWIGQARMRHFQKYQESL
jgi:predicted flap endonuclease-1-like 5' DNA nuclease